MGDRKWWEIVEEAVEPTSVWRECTTDEGLDYYFNTETNETSWDKPAELMTKEELSASGDWVWVPHETQAFVPARKLGAKGKKAEVELEDGAGSQASQAVCATQGETQRCEHS